jgi:hypothetical protein
VRVIANVSQHMAPVAKPLSLLLWGALAYSILIVWGGAWLVAASRSRPFPVEEVATLLIQTLIAFIPFGLALLLVRFHRTSASFAQILNAAIAGAMCSLLLWGYCIYDGLTYDGRGGANIGLGVLMLASPLIVYVPMHLMLSGAQSSNAG